MGPMQMGRDKKEDKEEINKYCISKGDKSYTDPDTATSCTTSKKCNAIKRLA